MPDLKIKLGSLELDNPIIVFSGYATETESLIAKADAFGPGAIVLKTALPDTDYANVVKPYAPNRYPSIRVKFGSCEDALEILLACPAPYFKRLEYAMTQDERIVKEICEAVRESVRIPVGVKIMPFSHLARAARETGIYWITFGGVFLAGPGVDLETLEPEIPGSVFISGSRLYKYVTAEPSSPSQR